MKRSLKTALLTSAFALFVAACSNEYTEIQGFDIPTDHQGVSPLSRAAENAFDVPSFRRTYGVGFSYDAIYGERCNMRDIRCQVFDLDGIEKLKTSEGENLLYINRNNATTISSETSYSRSEYVQSADFHADAKANLILISGKAEGSVSLWEGGERNEFICVTKVISPALSLKLDDVSLREYVITDKRYELLSKNFLECCKWMEKYNDVAVIDSFLHRYGTHVVTSAVVGGRLDLTMKMNLDSLLDISDVKILGELSVSDIVKMEGSSESYSKELNLMNSAECQISIRGGDLSLIPSDLLHFTFGKRPKLNSYAKQWMNSLRYDPEDFQNSNLELCEMDVRPIWDFIPNQKVAQLVRSRVAATAVELIQELGYQNGVCTAIKINDQVKCKILGKSTTFNNLAVSNVIASGRYVATICRERISDIDNNNDVAVLYPIYDREVNLSSGFCLAKGHAYHVRNLRNGYSVNDLGETTETTIYLNCGVPGTAHYDNIKYLPSYVVAGVEIPYSVKKDGQIDSSRPYYRVRKSGLDFHLWNADGSSAVQGNIEGLPNWTYDSKKKIMVRNAQYKYYWNPKEISY